jgi:PPOX class probable F420-dependent enzyme
MPPMDTGEARRLFAAARVAHLATVDAAGTPHLVPVTFAVHDGSTGGIVTAVDHKPKRTPRLRRLDNIAANPAVCLLVDAYDEDWDRLWWVRADGRARITAPDQGPARAAVALLQDKYPQYRADPPDGPVIEIAVARWRGWRARADGAAQPA